MRKPSPKHRAAIKVDAAMVITDLEQALVAMRNCVEVNDNTPTRGNLALAKAHATAAIGGIGQLQGRAFHEPH